MLIELRRHSLKGVGDRKDVLSREGIELARRVGAEQMRGKHFTHIITSPLFRTAQTACAFAEGAGDFSVARFETSSALDVKRMTEWKAYFAKFDAKLMPSEDLIVEESQRMASEFLALRSNLPTDSHLLVVGHTPLLECLIHGLTNIVVDPLQECEGVVLDYDGERFTLVEEIRL